MFTKTAILFLYVACIALLVAGLTCGLLSIKKSESKANKSIVLFTIGLFVMCLYDMGIYYWNYVIGNFSSMEVMRIGNCIIALNIYLWVTLQGRVIQKSSLKLLTNLVKNYILFYAGLWLLLTIATSVEYFYTMKWLLLATDVVLIIGALAVSIAYIIYAAVDNRKIDLYYMTIVSASLLWNYISYFWGETSVYWGNSEFIREPLDMTIIFWLIISGATLAYVYRTQFREAFGEKEAKARELVEVKGRLEDRIEAVCEQYGLTPRERELTELIYAGKSNKEIAESLFLSESTVKTHIYNIFRKLDVKNRVEVICVINGESVLTSEEREEEK